MNAAALANDLAAQVREQLAEERLAQTSALKTLEEQVKELRDVVAAIPPARDGKDGRDGVDGKDGRDGVDGKNGTDGVDGAKGLDAEPGKDGRDGRDGKDGIASVDQITAIASKAVDDRLEAEVRKQLAEGFAALPILKYRDVYQAGTEYRPGESVSWGGQVYIALEPTSSKPGDSKAWSLAVKRGRDAK